MTAVRSFARDRQSFATSLSTSIPRLQNRITVPMFEESTPLFRFNDARYRRVHQCSCFVADGQHQPRRVVRISP